MKYRIVHIFPKYEVFAEFLYEIHAKMFYESFSKSVKIDDFLKVEELKNNEWVNKDVKWN